MLVYNNINKTFKHSEKNISLQKSAEEVRSIKRKTLNLDNKHFLKSIGFKLKQK